MRQLQQRIRQTLAVAREDGPVAITRHGRPVGLLVNVEGLSWEAVVRLAAEQPRVPRQASRPAPPERPRMAAAEEWRAW